MNGLNKLKPICIDFHEKTARVYPTGIHPRSIIVTYFVRRKADLEETITIIYYLALTIELVKDGVTIDVTSSSSFKRLLL